MLYSVHKLYRLYYTSSYVNKQFSILTIFYHNPSNLSRLFCALLPHIPFLYFLCGHLVNIVRIGCICSHRIRNIAPVPKGTGACYIHYLNGLFGIIKSHHGGYHHGHILPCFRTSQRDIAFNFHQLIFLECYCYLLICGG